VKASGQPIKIDGADVTTVATARLDVEVSAGSIQLATRRLIVWHPIVDAMKRETGVTGHEANEGRLGGLAYIGTGWIRSPARPKSLQLLTVAHACGHIFLRDSQSGFSLPIHLRGRNRAGCIRGSGMARVGLALLLLAAGFASPTSAGEPIYIDPSATSQGAGSQMHPYRSWSSASWVEGGTYLQRRGTIARETLSVGADRVTLGAYGEGAKPVIAGSEEVGQEDRWRAEGNGIWSIGLVAKDPIVFAHDGQLGHRKPTTGALIQPWDYAYDAAVDRLLVRATDNPAHLARSLEMAVRDRAIDFDGHKDVTYQDLELRQTRGDVAWGGWGAQNARFLRVDFRQLAGYGLQFQKGSSGLVEDCTFTDWGLRNDQDYGIQVIGHGATESGPVDVRASTFISDQDWNKTELGAIMSDKKGWVRSVVGSFFAGSGTLSGDAIAIWRPAGRASSITITNNRIIRPGRHGVLLQDLNFFGARPTVVVEGNYIERAAAGDDLDVEALRVWAHDGHTAVTVSGNIIKGTIAGRYPHNGIQLRETDGTRVIGNVVTGTDNGLVIERQSRHVAVCDNVLAEGRSFGLVLAPDSSIAAISGNQFFQNAAGAISGSPDKPLTCGSH
jgi:hypothetical protein